jgi:hypothetical protein
MIVCVKCGQNVKPVNHKEYGDCLFCECVAMVKNAISLREMPEEWEFDPEGLMDGMYEGPNRLSDGKMPCVPDGFPKELIIPTRELRNLNGSPLKPEKT